MWDGTWAPVTFSLVPSTLLQTGCEALRVLATAAVRIVRRFTDNAAVNFRGRASWCPTYALLHLWNFWSGMVRVPLQQMRPDRSAVCQAHSRDVETHACESRGDVRGVRNSSPRWEAQPVSKAQPALHQEEGSCEGSRGRATRACQPSPTRPSCSTGSGHSEGQIWSRKTLLMCVELARVCRRKEGGSMSAENVDLELSP